jgi:hypothetical protein
MSGRELAELYFRRWPVQENAFKELSSSVRLDQHRGNCSRMVTNVAVVTELEQLEARLDRDVTKLGELSSARVLLEKESKQQQQTLHKAEAALAVRQRRLDERIEQGRTEGKMFSRIVIDHHQVTQKVEAIRKGVKDVQSKLQRNETSQTKLEARIEKTTHRQKKLKPHKTIREVDTAQDTFLTAMKLTAAQLISFVLREYLLLLKITSQTFIQQVLTTRGRREVYDTHELVTFYENERDPEVTAALVHACKVLNKRNIIRNNRCVTYQVAAQYKNNSLPP